MRKTRLSGFLLGLSAFLILAGGMLAMAGVALGGRTSLYSSAAPNYAYEYAYEYSGADSATMEVNAFQKIEVDVALGDVYLVSGSDYGVELSWENENHKLYTEVTDGKLRVWDDDGKILGGLNSGTTAYIYFPSGAQFEEVSVKTALGDLQLEGFGAKALTVKNDLGQITLNDITAGNALLHLSLGDLEGYGVTVGGTATVENNLGDVYLTGSFRDLDVNCDMGKVTLSTDQPKSAYAYDLSTNMGSVYLDSEKHQGSSAKGGSGDYTLKVDNNMGDVEVIFG